MEETETVLTLADFGALLRERRIHKGLTEENVAAQLKITSRLVKAIEEGDMESMPHAVYARGFIRAYAKLLAVDDSVTHAACALLKDPEEELREQEIRVVVDGVFNHTGRDFFAFRDICENRESSPYRNWYRGVDFSRNSPMGDPYGYESWHGIWELPCLNLYNQEVKNYLLDTVRFWVREFDIDGIRLDCANVLDFQFMKELRRLTDTVKPAFWLMGEVIHGEYSRWVNDEMLHSVTNYEMHKSIYSAHNDHNYFELAHNVRRLEAVGKKLYTFADNHDEDRIASKLLNKSHLKPLYALLFSLPGIPSLYYGGEWGLEGRRTPHSDDELRPAIDIASAGSRFCGLTEFIGRLGRIHLEEPALHGGEYKELLLTNRQYAFARLSGAGDIITAANNDDNPAVISVPFNTCMNECTDLLSGRTFKVCDGRVQIELEGNDAVILRITEG